MNIQILHDNGVEMPFQPPWDPREQQVQLRPDLDPPVTEDSIRRAIDAANEARAEARRLMGLNPQPYPLGVCPADREGQLRQLDGLEAMRRLVLLHGADRVGRWLQYITAEEGEAS